MMDKKVRIQCRLCKSKDIKFLFKKNSYSIFKCKKCELFFADSKLSPKQLKDFYSSDYFAGNQDKLGYYNYFEEENSIRLNSKSRLEQIRKYAKGEKLLDIGCAAGFFLDEAKSYFKVSGVEISEDMAKFARKELKLKVFNAPFSSQTLVNTTFDVITMWDVIEHVSDPLDTIKNVKRLLKNNGLLVFSTGDVDSLFAKISKEHWHLFTPPQHLSYFSKKVIIKMLEENGFKIIRIDYDWNLFTLSYLLFTLKVKLARIKLGWIYDLIQKTPFKDIKIPMNLFDIMTVYARKI